jgi:hypothetical protein
MTRFGASRPTRRRLFLLAAFGAGVAAAGCVDSAVEMSAGRQAAVPRPRLAARPGVSPSGASIVLTSVDGASEATAGRFRRLFAEAAEARDIVTAAADAATYRVRGYVAAASAPGGAKLSYVWDVFDRSGRRARRIADELPVPAGSEPSEAREEKALAELARRSAEDIAAFLSNTPEAIAAANGGGAGLSVVEAQRAASPGGAPRGGGLAQAK